jgi:hypothetical protein
MGQRQQQNMPTHRRVHPADGLAEETADKIEKEAEAYTAK